MRSTGFSSPPRGLDRRPSPGKSAVVPGSGAKEVALGRLRTLTILLTLGAWGATTDGPPPEGVTTSPGAPARAPLQVPAGEYLKAGTRLISTGQNELAARYLKVATD